MIRVSILVSTLMWIEMAAGQVPRSYEAPRAKGAIKIDGKLDEAAWKGAAWTPEFTTIDQGAPAAKRTRAKMMWDEQYLYVAVEMEEPHLWSTYKDHDAQIFRDRAVEIFWDPEGDGLDYFEWQINAAGTTWDLKLTKPYKKGGKADNGWEIPGLKQAIELRGTLNDPRDTDRGWTVELAFPWAAFAGAKAPAVGAEWRVTMSRVDWKTDVQDGKYVKDEKAPGRFWLWSPHGEPDMHLPEKFGRVRFVK
ncbi:MAG: carbohydrate-binding family 9-like protein [Bryobacteraceae bacterium]|nr:carbohydrate-binding family 9-like protein [Bryobacteraceae bacterium]